MPEEYPKRMKAVGVMCRDCETRVQAGNGP